MLRTLSVLAVAAALTAASGYVHGLYSGRWDDPAALGRAAARLDRVPLQIGDWEGQADELDARSVKMAGFRAYVSRTYKHRRTGASVSVLLACGHAGPLSVHTPEQCYRGLGYRQQGAAESFAPQAGPSTPYGTLRTARFVKGEGAAAAYLRINWAWERGAGWEALGNPRFALAGTPAVYKMYVIHQMERADESPMQGPSSEFLREALPVLRQALDPKS
jgi:hypothetical protein